MADRRRMTLSGRRRQNCPALELSSLFYAAIIATRQEIGTSSLGDVVLMPLVGLRQIKYGVIVIVAAFNLVGEAMLHGGPGLLDAVR